MYTPSLSAYSTSTFRPAFSRAAADRSSDAAWNSAFAFVTVGASTSAPSAFASASYRAMTFGSDTLYSDSARIGAVFSTFVPISGVIAHRSVGLVPVRPVTSRSGRSPMNVSTSKSSQALPSEVTFDRSMLPAWISFLPSSVFCGPNTPIGWTPKSHSAAAELTYATTFAGRLSRLTLVPRSSVNSQAPLPEALAGVSSPQPASAAAAANPPAAARKPRRLMGRNDMATSLTLVRVGIPYFTDVLLADHASHKVA